MIKFEFLRFFKGRKLIFSFISIILILLTNTVLEISLTGINNSNNIRLMHLYSSFSQFFCFAFAPIIGYSIASDFEKNTIVFYSQNGISLLKVFISKFFVYSISIILLLISTISIYNIIFKFELYSLIIVSIHIILNMLYCICVGFLLSLLFKKSSTTTIAMILFYFLAAIINVIPIPFVKGFLTIIDNNSFTEHFISSFLNVGSKSLNFKETITITNSNTLMSIGLCILWILIIFIISIFIVVKEDYKRNNLKFV
ncbi:hypothetical protein ACOAKC_08535 [Hathewaya histolytica]|uniref:hypothetical protein n=1 Tax=Hathewaya histolytica TaxID=1498 RepID=UPI003B68045D